MPDFKSVQTLPWSPPTPRKSTTQSSASSSVSKVAPSSPYGITLEEVRKLNQDQMTEANLEELARIGGVIALATLLCVNVEHGLPQTEIDTNFTVRRDLFGRNLFPESPMKGLFRLFVESLQDTTLIILIIAAIASMVTGYMEHPETGWSEGVAILLGVILVAVVTSINNYTKEKQFRALSAKNDDVLVKVLRDGKPDQVPVGEISVGEVIILETGDRVPADAVLINGSDLKCNESSLTGEPDDVSKVHKKDPFLLSSCLVASGRGECLVIAVGSESRWGKIKSKLVCEQKATPLMEKLEEMAKHIGYVGMGFSIATMVAMIIIYATSDDKKLEYSWPSYILHTFLIGVTIIVVAIPEGLPLAVTISLSYSTKKMLRDNNLIRVLAACETMGNVTSICSDKTGTLTENKMTVVQGWVLGKFFKDELTNTSRTQLQVNERALDELAVNIAVNTSAYLKDVNGAPQVQGNKTEGAVLLWMNKLRLSITDLRRENFQITRGDRLFPFSSEKKSMAAIVKRSDGTCRLYSKGAAEVILTRATKYIDVDGHIQRLTSSKRDELNRIIRQMAESALRTICIGHRDFEAGELPSDLQSLPDAPDQELVVNAIFGIQDPLRPDVTDAIRDCKRAGIMVRMVTGDNIHTASAIAKQCGIMTEDGVALEGPVFRSMSVEEVSKLIPRLQVLARSSPDDKFRLVNLLKDRSEVVGVTGDGTNDAPALRTADVGMAMGITGTDLAKEASDIIIMDDKFSSIRKAVLWGRCVYDNIRKFLQFQLTVNIVALVVTFVSAVTGKEPPLNSVMMLWINLIMDTMGALALGTEAPTEALLDRRPYKKSAKLLGRCMVKNIIVQSLFQLLLVFLLLIYGAEQFGYHDGNKCVSWKYSVKSSFPTLSNDTCVTVNGDTCWSLSCDDYAQNSTVPEYPVDCLDDTCTAYDYRHYTIIFNTFVFSQLFNEFNARKTNNDWRVFNGLVANPLFIMIVLITLFVQVLLAEFGGDFIKTSGISFTHWLICFGFGALSLPVGIIMRLIPVTESPGAFANPNGISQG
ncbi:Cation transporting ATPase C-terminal domain [Phytophthora infestans]|uniref:Calcium-transporting ATPase n=1 Tax=Phytophthora infestans TaxID=4787 RepID=A0A833SX15_PHYIN|nr:Cation transporting ATPase C-terminal domain [Phytophthora infestans]KAF4137876.1 Cation transporting ATPase [Phytophthora infestans]